MKKTILIFLILLSGCTSNFNDTISEEIGINIFSQDENLIVNFVPTEKTSIKEIIDKDFSHAAIISETGEVNLLGSDFYIDKEKKSIFATDGEKKFENIAGIYLTNMYNSITNAYYQMEEYLKNDEKIMTVLLDGFSYNQYKNAHEKGYIPFLSKYFKYPALSVLTPVTNAGFAAIITGQTPDVNGVDDRSVRQINVDSIFQYSINNSKNSILLEGDIKILNTEIEPELHIDQNKDSDTDDEMFESALSASKENYDLIFIHFHGIDDRGHSFGPNSDETMDYIKIIDRYLETLSEIWDGPIILVADHGMHETSEGGGHGICYQSDMVVPYFIKEK